MSQGNYVLVGGGNVFKGGKGKRGATRGYFTSQRIYLKPETGPKQKAVYTPQQLSIKALTAALRKTNITSDLVTPLADQFIFDQELRFMNMKVLANVLVHFNKKQVFNKQFFQQDEIIREMMALGPQGNKAPKNDDLLIFIMRMQGTYIRYYKHIQDVVDANQIRKGELELQVTAAETETE